jgi:hypothetical protein
MLIVYRKLVSNPMNYFLDAHGVRINSMAQMDHSRSINGRQGDDLGKAECVGHRIDSECAASRADKKFESEFFGQSPKPAPHFMRFCRLCSDGRQASQIGQLKGKVYVSVRGEPMRRRQFITLIGGAAAAWPLAARAQQSSNKIPVVGVLWHAGSAEEEEVYLSVLVKAFNDLGYVEGKNIHLDHRFPNENPDRFRHWRENLSMKSPTSLSR